MKERHKSNVAVILILTRENKNKTEILLQKRYNTGYCDGQYDLSASGHVESSEYIVDSIIREAKEEIKVDIKKEDLKLFTTIHNIFPESLQYINFYFLCDNYQGNIEIGESNKCSELLWTDINNLPENVMDVRKVAVNNLLNGISFSEERE